MMIFNTIMKRSDYVDKRLIKEDCKEICIFLIMLFSCFIFKVKAMDRSGYEDTQHKKENIKKKEKKKEMK